MLHASLAGHPPRITFTNDFHELVRGDLAPGRTVTLRYDPLRIIPNNENYTFGDPDLPIVAHVIFRPGEPAATHTLLSPSGMLESPEINATGAGDMLRTEFVIPENAAGITMWFTYASPVSGMYRDDDEGRNFHFGFTNRQIKVLSATVVESPDGDTSIFALSAATIAAVTGVTVRFVGVNDPATPKTERDLHRTERDENGWPVWELAGVDVPRGAILRFKIYYWIGSIRYKDDNNGMYYLAPQPGPEHVPAPPEELARAARAWS
jgi:hypothetical protein